MHRYFPHTPADIEAMLGACGATQLDDLYADVDPSLRLKEPYKLRRGMDEESVRRFFDILAEKNLPVDTCFAGAGFYNHLVPAAVKSIASRSEFLTAYTPYQPEISQGTLQYIFEYQTMMARLTGMEISNASMYDGATATAEAVMMAVASLRKRDVALVSLTLNPAVRRVVDTYARYKGIAIIDIPADKFGCTDREALAALLEEHSKRVAAVLVPSPNYFGIIENHDGLADLVHAHKALLIINCIAADLATIKTPGEYGADIACGDAQSLGIPLSYGGPYLGFLCTTKALMRKMPGRIVGATTDSCGRRSFVLTLQAREQHIRREKATSNICSNQGLMTLWVAAYMTLMGADGLRAVNNHGATAAHTLAMLLEATGRFKLRYPVSPFLNEFLMDVDKSIDLDVFISDALVEGILPGVKVDDHGLLIACTELINSDDVAQFLELANSSCAENND